MKHVDFRFTLDTKGGDAESAAFRTNLLEGFSIVASWGADGGTTRTGILKLQISNDAFMRRAVAGNESDLQEILFNDQENANATWVDMPGSTKTVTDAADSHAWAVADAYYNAVRLVFVGTGAGGATPDNVVGIFHGQGQA